MSKEFSKGVSNSSQNLNEFGQGLSSDSCLRLKEIPFHSQERRVCSIHILLRTAEMIRQDHKFDHLHIAF